MAGICDSENSHVINNVRGKYLGQRLSVGFFNNDEFNLKSDLDDKDEEADNINS